MASTPKVRSPWVVFAIAATGGYITTLDLSIVNVAFAEIAKTYSSASRADLSWIVTIYNIMFASLLIVGGMPMIGMIVAPSASAACIAS